mmetsp:Transcript_8878/g.21101  ORF Transcript_8878/g.21101 Transcript_8878/m.21101 type:complete len:249 (+) Transcript_8878:346-1092(+)
MHNRAQLSNTAGTRDHSHQHLPPPPPPRPAGPLPGVHLRRVGLLRAEVAAPLLVLRLLPVPGGSGRSPHNHQGGMAPPPGAAELGTEREQGGGGGGGGGGEGAGGRGAGARRQDLTGGGVPGGEASLRVVRGHCQGKLRVEVHPSDLRSRRPHQAARSDRQRAAHRSPQLGPDFRRLPDIPQHHLRPHQAPHPDPPRALADTHRGRNQARGWKRASHRGSPRVPRVPQTHALGEHRAGHGGQATGPVW